MVKLNLIGFKQFQQVMNKLPEQIKKEVGVQVRLGAEQFRGLAIKDAPADTSFLKGKIVVEPQTAGELRYEVISGSKYSAPMEFGTKTKFQPIPGIDASEFKGQPTGGNFRQLVNRIAIWVGRKGIAGTFSTGIKRKKGGGFEQGKTSRRRLGSKLDQIAENYQVAYLIARSIVKNGVTPHPFFFKQFPIVRRDLFRNIRRTLKDLTG